jgi:hypothetical protein
MQRQAHLAEARLHIVPRPSAPRCGPAVFHLSARHRCDRTAADRFIQANAIPRLECVRHLRSRTGGLFIRVEVRSRVPVHTRSQLSRNAIVSRHLRIAEIQLSHAYGTSETPERSSVMGTIYGTQTISEMETTICVVTGKSTFSRSAQEIGIATGTATATIGGMVTDAASLMDRG